MSLINGLKSIAKQTASEVEKTAAKVEKPAQQVATTAKKAITQAKSDFESKVIGNGYPSGPAQFRARGKQISAQVATMNLGAPQKQVLGQLAQLGVSPVDIWQGSHVVVNGDGGALYNQWKQLGATPRESSHYPNVKCQQYEITFGNHAFLFGKNANGDTWFQMEGHWFEGLKDPGTSAEHLLDYGRYRVSKENVGPMGLSPHSEHHDPIELQYG